MNIIYTKTDIGYKSMMCQISNICIHSPQKVRYLILSIDIYIWGHQLCAFIFHEFLVARWKWLQPLDKFQAKLKKISLTNVLVCGQLNRIACILGHEPDDHLYYQGYEAHTLTKELSRPNMEAMIIRLHKNLQFVNPIL